MKQVHLGTAASLLLCLGSLGEPAFASNIVSPHLRRVTEAVEAWQASGRREPLAVPAPLRAAVRPIEIARTAFGAAGADASDPMLSVILRTSDPEILRMSGARVRTVAGPIVTADVPLSLIRQFDSMPGLISADVPHMLKPLLDVSRIDTRADVAQGSSQPPYSGASGQGVVVGVVDTGIDLDHGDFLNANGTTRVLYVWDQDDNVGPHPSGYGYGTEWNAASINAGTFREIDDDGHGTHVTGIAAGNGRAASSQSEQFDYAGIAPEADIIFVKTIFNEAALIDGVAWIQNRAGSKPSAINLSVGSQYGAHDGTSNLDVALAALAGPGRIIVAAAGNEGNSFTHAEVTVPGNGTVDMPFLVCSNPGGSCAYTPNAGNSSGQGNDYVLLEAYSSSSNFSMSILTPNQTVVGPVGATGTVSTNTSQGNVDMEAAVDPANGDRAVFIDIWDKSTTAPPAAGTWILRVQNNQPTARELDVWLYFWVLGQGYVYVYWDNGTQAENAELISSPASSDSVIAVGAYITKTSWPCVANPGGACGYTGQLTLGEIAPFSSPGPRRDGFAKPEVSAPGMGIASSLSKDATGPLFQSPYGEIPGGLRYVSQGTSQAAPHVTGAAALILQRRPNASVNDVSLALRGTARHDTYTGPGYSNDFGHGKLDVADAVELFVPVSLLSLSAQWDDGKAVVSWELKETEEGVSFRVDRGPSAQGPFTPQTEWLHGDLSFSWTDPAPVASEPWYRLRSLDRTGEEKILGVTPLTSQPAITRLLANSPNPFHASTRIAFDLDRPGNVTVDVLDIAGRLVTRLVSGARAAGRNEIEWNGLDGSGRHVAPGIYVVRLITPNTVLARRMVMAS